MEDLKTNIIPRNKIILFITLSFIISSILRIYAFNNWGVSNNDDVIYHGLAESIFKGKGLYFDLMKYAPHLQGIQDGTHVHFPPGYPFIIGLQSLIIKDARLLKAIEWILITGINSILITLISKIILKRITYISIIFSFFPTVFIYGIGTITIGSENWCVLLTLIGLLYCLTYSRNRDLKMLFSANCLFSMAYLVRPEGIIYYSSSIMALIYSLHYELTEVFKNRSFNNYLFRRIITFVIPLIIFVFPYVNFLYQKLGKLTLTGKTQNWDNIASLELEAMSSVERYTNNLLTFIDVLFNSPYFLGISFTLLSIMIIINILVKSRLNFNDIEPRLKKDIMIVSAPLPFCLITYIRYSSYARSIYCFVPIIIIVSLILFYICNILFDNSNILKTNFAIFGKKLSLTYLIILGTLLNISYPIFSQSFLSNSPVLYYKLSNKLIPFKSKYDDDKYNIWSRDLSASVFRKDVNLCNEYKAINKESVYNYPKHRFAKECRDELDYIFLSDISHTSLHEPSKWEMYAMGKNTLTINKIEFIKIAEIQNKDKTSKIVAFKNSNN